jgi:hypothetical protein
VPLSDSGLLSLLKGLLRRSTVAGKQRIFDFGYARYRLFFWKVLLVMRLPLDLFRTHSLRRGGATALPHETKSVEEVILIGRWKSLQSARTYLRAGEALLASFLAAQTEEQEQRVSFLVSLAQDFFLDW